MNTYYAYQFVDTDPDDIKKNDGIISLADAINLFDSFPWIQQFNEILKRKSLNQTSTSPAIYFLITETNFLRISARNDKGFLVYFQQEEKQASQYISNNILENNKSISIEQYIAYFYNDDINEVLEMNENHSFLDEKIELKLNYNSNSLFFPLLYLLIPFIYIPFSKEGLAFSFSISFIISSIIFLFTIPHLFLNYSYWKNDKGQILSYDSKQLVITITQNGKSFEISKLDINSIDLIHVSKTKSSFKEYKYLRLNTNNKTFIITHLTVEPKIFLSILNVNYREIEAFYPKLNFNLKSKKEIEKIQEQYEQKRLEFLKTYSSFETKKLEEIISQSYNYKDYAISAASEILNNRKVEINS